MSKMLVLQYATVLILCVTSALTSTVNQSTKSDKKQPLGLEKLFRSSKNDTEINTLSREIESSKNNDSMLVSESGSKNPIITEGGPVSNDFKEEIESTIKPTISKENKLSEIKKYKPSSKEIINKLNPHNKSNIVPRKGVGSEEDKKMETETGIQYSEGSLNIDKPLKIDDLPSAKSNNETKTLTPVPEVKSDPKNSQKDSEFDGKQEVTLNKNSTAKVIIVPGHPNDTSIHKKKPTYTTGEGDDDGKGMPSSPTQTEIGMPKKVDYIVPVVITIMATPVLGIAAFVLYTRGRDCWDKRHYRRMDFLIDGMYND